MSQLLDDKFGSLSALNLATSIFVAWLRLRGRAQPDARSFGQAVQDAGADGVGVGRGAA